MALSETKTQPAKEQGSVVQNPPPPSSDVIELNVGGQVYYTRHATLTGAPNSLFGKLFSSSSSSNNKNKKGSTNDLLSRDLRGRCFIDRDGFLFRYVLDYLRDQQVVLPEHFPERGRLKREAEYFQLPELVKLLSSDDSKLVSDDCSDLEDTESQQGKDHHRFYSSYSLDRRYGYITVGFRGGGMMTRESQVDAKAKKVPRIFISGRVGLAKEVFGDALNENRDADEIRDAMNSLDLKVEELGRDLDDARSHSAKTADDLAERTRQNEELRSIATDLEVKTNRTDVANLQQRSQIVKNQVQIGDLESRLRVLRSEKEALLNTIDQMNDRHHGELVALSKQAQGLAGSDSSRQIEIITALNEKNAQMAKKERSVRSTLNNEAAEHLATKKTLEEQKRVFNELTAKVGGVQSEHACLAGTLTKQFGCPPSAASIIGAVSHAARYQKEWESMNTQVSEQKLELDTARCELAQTRQWLEIERKKSHLEASRRRNQQSHGIPFSSLLNECVIRFLNTFVSNTRDLNLRSIATVLLANANTQGYGDPDMWNRFGEEVTNSKHLTQLVEQFKQRSVRAMSRMMETLAENQERCGTLLARVNSSLGRLAPKVLRCAPLTAGPVGSLYERSLKLHVSARDLATTPSVQMRSGRVPLTSITSVYGGNTGFLPKYIQPRTARHELPAGLEPPTRF